MTTVGYGVPDHEIRKLVHDIRGPVATMSGIYQELSDAVQVLADSVGDEDGPSAARLRRVDDVLTEDISPCLYHLGASLDSLQQRISALEQQYMATAEQ